jgi:hypothetical protein
MISTVRACLSPLEMQLLHLNDCMIFPQLNLASVIRDLRRLANGESDSHGQSDACNRYL